MKQAHGTYHEYLFVAACLHFPRSVVVHSLSSFCVLPIYIPPRGRALTLHFIYTLSPNVWATSSNRPTFIISHRRARRCFIKNAGDLAGGGNEKGAIRFPRFAGNISSTSSLFDAGGGDKVNIAIKRLYVLLQRRGDKVWYVCACVKQEMFTNVAVSWDKKKLN